MQVLAFASQKGGAGKTTLAGHIAVQAERRQFRSSECLPYATARNRTSALR